MKNIRSLVALFLISVFMSQGAYASAPVSSVNPNIPAQNSPLSSSVLRSQFGATATDIDTIFTGTYVGANQLLGNTVAGTAVGITVPPCTTGLTWTNGVGLGCASGSGTGITALTGDIAASGTGSVAATLTNSTTARTDIGLGTAATPQFAGLALSGLENINLNTGSLIAALTGTTLHQANVDGALNRHQLDAFANSAHFSAVRADGTAAAPTTLQSADVIGSFNGWGYDGTAYGAAASWQIATSQAWTPSAHGSVASIWTTPNGTTTPVQQVIVGNDGGVTLGSPTGGDKGAGTLNASGIYVNGVAVSTTGSGGSGALSSLTAATGANTIDNGANSQEWDYNALTTGTGFKSTSTGITTGRMLDIEANNAAGTGYGGYFGQSATGAGYGVYATEMGTNNTGYAGYFSNSATTGYAVEADGNVKVNLGSSSSNLFQVISNPVSASNNSTTSLLSGSLSRDFPKVLAASWILAIRCWGGFDPLTALPDDIAGGQAMNTGKTLFAQLMDFLPWSTFDRIVARYNGDRAVRTLPCAAQFQVMAFAQITYRESLRDIEACLSAQSAKLYHMGLPGPVRRSTLADANEARDWRIYAEFAQRLIAQARRLYAGDDLDVDLPSTVYALDSTTIDLCLSVFPWANFRSTKAAVKMHTLLDLRGNIPSFIHISDGKLHDVHALDMLLPEPGAIYVMDRGYVDFARLHVLHEAGAFFVTRAKSNMDAHRIYSAPADRSAGVISDQTIAMDGYFTQRHYPAHLRRIRFKDPETGKTLIFLTNQVTLPALTICALYKSRWQVELFFKWIKQHLRIKQFYGVSENAVKTQIWIAVSVYVLVAIVRKRLRLEVSLYTLLQVFSVTVFEKMPIQSALFATPYRLDDAEDRNQLELFTF